MMRVTDLAQLLVARVLSAGDCAVDATVGNGHDTLFLAKAVGPSGRVYGFDVQAEALAMARRTVAGMENVTLFHAGHERMADHLPAEAEGQIAAAMFNLGYLPGADAAVITRAETTLSALDLALILVRVGGVVSVVVYPGHDGGAGEADAVRAWARALPGEFAASVHARVNTRTPAPELILIERLR